VKTEVLQRAGLVDPNCCLSVVTANRSLDLAFASSVDRDNALRGLKAVLAQLPHPVRYL